jgi:RNA polymerase sigma-70 factor (ECF subfamily)
MTGAENSFPREPFSAIGCTSARGKNVIVVTVEQAEQSPEDLALQCQAGRRDAFETLVERYEQRLFAFLYQLVGNAHDAEDLTQDTFLKAYQNIHRYNSAFKFTTWIFTIAKRTAANHRRSARTWEPLPEDQEVAQDDPASVLERKDDGASIWDLAKKLKPDQYTVLWLRYGEGFSIAETAKVMKTNSIRVRVLLHRARHHLAKSLGTSGIRNSTERPL